MKEPKLNGGNVVGPNVNICVYLVPNLCEPDENDTSGGEYYPTDFAHLSEELRNHGDHAWLAGQIHM